MSDWARAVCAQLVAESGVHHVLVDCVGDSVARFVGYAPRGALRCTLAVRMRHAPSTVYVLAEHVARRAGEYDVAARQLPGLGDAVLLLRGDTRTLDAIRLLAALPPQSHCTCTRCAARRHRRQRWHFARCAGLHQSARAA